MSRPCRIVLRVSSIGGSAPAPDAIAFCASLRLKDAHPTLSQTTLMNERRKGGD